MILTHPFLITPRLLPGVRVGGGFIAIEYFCMDGPRTRWRVTIDAPDLDGETYEDTTMTSGMGDHSLQSAMENYLGFLLYEVDHARYGDPIEGDDPLFPERVVAWATDYEDELNDLWLTITETPDLIREE